MSDYGRLIVRDLAFERVLGEASRAIYDEGFAVIARIDIRDHFWRDLSRDIRPYVILEVWSPDSAFEALQHNLEIGAILPTRFAIYELADAQTAVVVSDALSPMAAVPDWRRNNAALASMADRESERVARVLARLRDAAAHRGSATPAA